MATVVHRAEPDALDDPNRVKVVLDRARPRALLLAQRRSRTARDGAAPRCWQHVGLYAYRRDVPAALRRRSRRTPLERAEALEQLRALEHGYRDPLRGDRGLAQRAGGRAGRRRARRGAPRWRRPLRLTPAARRPRSRRPAAARARLRAVPALGRGALVGRDHLAALAARCSSARRRPPPRRRCRVLPRPGARRGARGRAGRRAGGARSPLYGALELAAAAGRSRCRRCSGSAEARSPGLRRAARRARRAGRAAPRSGARRDAARGSAAFGATLPALASAALGDARRARRPRRRCSTARTSSARRSGSTSRVRAAGAHRRSGRLRRRRRVPRAGGRRRRSLAGRALPGDGASPRAPRRGQRAPRTPPRARATRRARGALGLRLLRRQVLLVQAFALVLDQSVYAFGAVVLVDAARRSRSARSLVAGALAHARRRRRRRRPRRRRS